MMQKKASSLASSVWYCPKNLGCSRQEGGGRTDSTSDVWSVVGQWLQLHFDDVVLALSDEVGSVLHFHFIPHTLTPDRTAPWPSGRPH